jgi:hypothetical protein
LSLRLCAFIKYIPGLEMLLRLSWNKYDDSQGI